MEVKGKYLKGNRHLELGKKTKANPANFLSLHHHIFKLYLAEMLTVLENLRIHCTDQEVLFRLSNEVNSVISFNFTLFLDPGCFFIC